MAEFKPRSASEGDDEDKDNSFVQDWLERMIEDDPEGQDSKKKSRFTKLFKPVFRMLFPRNERGEAKTESKAEPSMFGANILGVSKDSSEDEDVPFSSPLESETLDKKEVSAEENIENEDNQVVTDDREENLELEQPQESDLEKEPEFDEVGDREKSADIPAEEVPEELVRASLDGESEFDENGGLDTDIQGGNSNFDRVNTLKTSEQVSKPDTKNSAGPAVLAFIGAEILSRKRDRGIRKEQKKIEKEQKAELKSLKEKSASKETVAKLNNSNRQQIDSLMEKRKFSQQNTQKAEVKREKISIKEKIKNSFTSAKYENKPQSVSQPKSEEATPLLSIIKDKDEEIRKKMERREIESLIGDSAQEDQSAKNTERYFETRHEIKEHVATKDVDYLAPSDKESDGQVRRDSGNSTAEQITQTTLGASISKEKFGNYQNGASKSPQITIQFIMLAGIIFAIIIIKLFFM